MVWPIIRGESYVGETGKSIKAVELGANPRGCCRKIPIALIDPIAGGVNLRLARYPPIVHGWVSIRADHFCYGNLLRQISCVVPQLLRSAAANEMRVPACPLSTGLIC